MTINKFLLPQSYVAAIKRLYKNYRRKQRIKSFLKGADSPGDVINAYQLFLSMELPFQQRPKEVLDQIAATGKSSITLRHQYFQNTAIEFDLLDNFQMAICREFFIENIRKCFSPCRPVVAHVFTPDVEVVPNTFII